MFYSCVLNKYESTQDFAPSNSDCIDQSAINDEIFNKCTFVGLSNAIDLKC